MTNTRRKERLEARIGQEEKNLLQRAAQIRGESTSVFVISTALKSAKEIIAESEQIIQSQRDKEVFVDAILNPGQPNDYLKEAYAEYKKRNDS